MYKDPDKQREADRERQRRYRAKKESVTTLGVIGGVTDTKRRYVGEGVTKPRRGKDIKCFADLPPDVQQTIDRLSVVDGKIDQTVKVNRTAIAIHYQHCFPGRYYPVSHYPQDASVIGKPGDAVYNGVCTEDWRHERGR